MKNQTKKLNKEWHSKHPMPVNPTIEQKIKWHLQHQENCGCRKVPDKIIKEMNKRKIKF